MSKSRLSIIKCNPLFLYIIASIFISYVGYTLLAVSHAAILFFMFPIAMSLYFLFRNGHEIKNNISLILLLGFAVLMILSVFLNMNRVKPDKSVFVITAAVSVLLTAPFLSRQEENAFQTEYLKKIAWIYIGISFVLSCFGLFFAYSKIIIEPNIGFVVAGRLRLIIHENILGMLMSLAISFIYLLLLDDKNRSIPKDVFLIIAAVTCYLTMVYTDCRTAKIALMPTTFMFLFFLLRKKCAKTGIVLKNVLAVLGGLLACFALWKMQGVLYGALVKTVERTTVESSRAVAVDNDRITIWTTAIKGFIHDKQSMLVGASPALVKDVFLVAKEDHFHNSYLAVLLNYGIPAFLVMCALLVFLMKNMIRIVFTKKEVSDNIRFLPFITVSILFMGLTEELFVTPDFIQCFSVILFLLSGYIFNISDSLSDRIK